MIRNRDSLAHSPGREVALDCIEAAIEGADPETATRDAVSLTGDTLDIGGATYDLTKYEDIVVVGAGKATGGATRALESTLGERITDGVVVTKMPTDTAYVRAITGDHPVPSEQNVEATAEILDLVDAAGEETLVVVVLTGGASALLSAPASDLSLSHLQETTDRLLKNGVPIDEINAVRKHLSAVKGGQLARRGDPARVVGVMLSDVVGDDLGTIGSGPTAPDKTTYADAVAVLDRYDVDVPSAVRTHLYGGVEGGRSETPGPGETAVDRADNHVVVNNATALESAETAARDAGYESLRLSSRIRGEAREVVKPLVAVSEEIAATGAPVEPPAVVLAGGESTVTITGEGGSGGPNQEAVLSGALELAEDTVLAAVDTDGEDGSSNAAGAIADAETVTDEARARRALDGNDAGAYLQEINAVIETGPTGTNVNDVVALVVSDRNE
ncbi:glycerate kinase [Halorubrum sp. CSM-61]|uniref:glycerate kinase type-2 family protein n=1 Tax=Halorubrum sp. CSM-61 TaxID=2485838 RepID=UPI000F4B9A15|nr:DUF4147 domain-containing protein [Halorubrum sp. CSM-61]